MQNKYRAELASSQSCFSIRRSLSRERILDWSIGKGPKIYLTELRDECHIWKEEGSTFPHHNACFQENYVQIKSLSHHGHEDGDSSACRPPSIKCGRTIWLTHRARAVWSAPPVAIRMADSPTGREPPTAHEQWVLLHGGQGGTSLEYQTYTSAHPFDTIVAGLLHSVRPSLVWHLNFSQWFDGLNHTNHVYFLYAYHPGWPKHPPRHPGHLSFGKKKFLCNDNLQKYKWFVWKGNLQKCGLKYLLNYLQTNYQEWFFAKKVNDLS